MPTPKSDPKKIEAFNTTRHKRMYGDDEENQKPNSTYTVVRDPKIIGPQESAIDQLRQAIADRNIAEAHNSPIAAIFIHSNGDVDVTPLAGTTLHPDSASPGNTNPGEEDFLWSHNINIVTTCHNPCYTYIFNGVTWDLIQYPCPTD